MTRNRFSLFAATAMLAMALVGCNGDSKSASNDSSSGGGSTPSAKFEPGFDVANPDPSMIQIGLVASQNGELRPWGVDCVNGALLAVKEFNDAGGVNGKKVQLLVSDSNSSAEQGRTAAVQLMSKGVVGILGEVASGITAQMAEAAKAKQIPVLAVGATKTTLTDIGPHVARVCYTDDLQGPVMAKFAYEELGLRNVAIVTDKKQPYSTGLSESFRNFYVKLGGKIVDEQFYESGATQFGPQLTNLKAKNPDGLFLSGYFNEVGPLARQARDAGITAKFLGGDGWDSSQILVSGGDAIVGGFFCNHYNNDEERPEVKNFLSKWQSAFGGTPGTTMGALGYDAAALMCDALKRAATPDSKALLPAIHDTTGFAGVSGQITLKGQNGNPPKRALVVELTKDEAHPQKFVKAYEAQEVLGK
jgi:branched-chain amino acid transport system substrate-binding protein